MTLIVKELIIRGIIKDDDSINESSLNSEKIKSYIDELRKEIEKDCVEKIMHKLKNMQHR